jgi:transposase
MISSEVRKLISSGQKKGMTLDAIARFYNVSRRTVQRLLRQERIEGNMEPQTHKCGRKTVLDEKLSKKLRDLIIQKPDISLNEIKHELNLPYSLAWIHGAIKKLGFTYKKRLFTPLKETALK